VEPGADLTPKGGGVGKKAKDGGGRRGEGSTVPGARKKETQNHGRRGKKKTEKKIGSTLRGGLGGKKKGGWVGVGGGGGGGGGGTGRPWGRVFSIPNMLLEKNRERGKKSLVVLWCQHVRPQAREMGVLLLPNKARTATFSRMRKTTKEKKTGRCPGQKGGPLRNREKKCRTVLKQKNGGPCLKKKKKKSIGGKKEKSTEGRGRGGKGARRVGFEKNRQLQKKKRGGKTLKMRSVGRSHRRHFREDN